MLSYILNRVTILLAATSIRAMLACPAASAQTYQIVELPVPPSSVSTAARAINAAGHIAGELKNSAGQYRPVTWIKGVATVLPVPAGYPGANATGISDTGDICGSAWTNGSFGFSAAVVWPAAGSPSLIPTLGGQYSAANGISASGTVVGWTSTYSDYKGSRAYRFAGATASAGLIPGGGGSWTVGNAINASGQIVGNGMNGLGRGHAFLDDPSEGLIHLGTLGGLSSDARAVSAGGHVAGYSHTGAQNAAVTDGFVAHAFLWHKGQMTDLGVLPGLVESQARGVNAAGVVVGRCTGAGFEETPRAFIWRDGALIDLNSLIPATSGWTLENANAINDSGWIVGSGLIAGKKRAFLLIPNP